MKKASTPIRIFIPVLLPFAAGTAGAPAAGACAAGWVAPHLVQNLAPSASGFPQLTQNAAIDLPPSESCRTRTCHTSRRPQPDYTSHDFVGGTTIVFSW